MNKKYGFIFLGLGIILLTMAGLSMTTGIFDRNKEKNDNPTSDSAKKFKSHDYIKTRDYNKKTKISFPIMDGLSINSLLSNDQIKKYSNEETTFDIMAIIYDNNNSLESFVDERYKVYYQPLQDEGIDVRSSDIDCKYLCKRITSYKDNEIYTDEFKIYIKSSDIDIAEITYKSNLKELDNGIINSIIQEIVVSYDASYLIGKVEGNKLNINFDLLNGDIVVLSLDNNSYEEVIGGNSNYLTTVKNRNNNEKVELYLRKRQLGGTIKEDIDMYNDMQNPGSNVEEINIQNKIFYKYDIDGRYRYAYIINDDCALLIQPDGNEINIEDFLDIVV